MEHCDFLVIGAGLAGLSFALDAARHGSVIILTKTRADESNTHYAQGGIATVWDPDDSFESHVADTLEAGAGLCSRDVVDFVVREAPGSIRDLMDWGVEFTRKPDGTIALGREGGHSARRVLHVDDHTGASIVEVLLAKVRAHPNIRVLERRMAVDLITDSWLAWRRGGVPPRPTTVKGAYVLDLGTGTVDVFAAEVVVLCTGGAGKVYLTTTNPDIATGDGIAMAWRSGALIANMEFTQFHPTCLYHPKTKNFLITEAMRGEGGVLRLLDGTPFMKKYHELGELAPRDIVARAIDAELKRSGTPHVLLDMTHHPRDFLQHRFPMIHARCMDLGIDIASVPIPVVPAAHFLCGGIQVDSHGESSIANLFALGECSCTGLHGANRLASNSLLECLVYAKRAARRIEGRLRGFRPPQDLPDWDVGKATNADEQVVIAQVWDEIRRFMWNYVGIMRTTRRLERARNRIHLVNEEIQHYYWDFRLTGDLLELRNLASVAGIIVDSALRRRESRGLHFNRDFPERDPRFLMPTVVSRVFYW